MFFFQKEKTKHYYIGLFRIAKAQIKNLNVVSMIFLPYIKDKQEKLEFPDFSEIDEKQIIYTKTRTFAQRQGLIITTALTA